MYLGNMHVCLGNIANFVGARICTFCDVSFLLNNWNAY